MDHVEKTNLVRTLVVIGFVCSAIFHYVLGVYWGKGYPYSTFLYVPNERFFDFYITYDAVKDLNPYFNIFSAYFPFAYVVVYPFTVLSMGFAYVVLVVGFLGFMVFLLWKYLPSSNFVDRAFTIFIFTIMSYPLLFTFERGNLEFIVFVFLALFVIFYSRGRENLAAISLACAIAMKGYPAVFSILFIVDRKWKQFYLTACYVILLTIISASLFEGGISVTILGMQKNLSFFKENFIDNILNCFQHNSSLFVPIMYFFEGSSFRESINKIYPFIAITIFLCSVLYIKYYVKTLWKKIAILTFLMILLPQISYPYKLIHIFLPLVLFLGDDIRSKLNYVYSVIFGVLLIQKDYYYINTNTSIDSIANCLLMIIFIIFIMIDNDNCIKEP